MLVLPALADSKSVSRLVESCAVSLYRRHFPTFYLKSHGEVDIAYVDGCVFMPLEIKWTEQLRPKDLKQIAKYPNGRILGKSRQYGEILGVPTEPLPDSPPSPGGVSLLLRKIRPISKGLRPSACVCG